MGTGTNKVEISVRRIGEYARIEENPRGSIARRVVMIPAEEIERVANEMLGVKMELAKEATAISNQLAEDWGQ